MRNNMDDLLEFTIPDWALSSLINGDDSGLEEEDIEKIDKFVNRIVEKYGNANFILPYEEEMDLGFQGYNDIDRLGNDCSLLYLRPSKNYTESSDTKETIYIYEDNEYTAKELIDLADEMAHYEKMDSGVYIDIDDVYSAIAFLGEDEVRIKGDVMMDGGMMADGGVMSQSWRSNKIYAVPINREIEVQGERLPYFYLHGEAENINGYDICNGNIDTFKDCLNQGAFLCELEFVDGRKDDAICFTKFDGFRRMEGLIVLLSDKEHIEHAIDYLEFKSRPSMYSNEEDYLSSIGLLKVISDKVKSKMADGGYMAKGGGVDEFHWKNTKHGTLLYSKNEYQGISITKNSEGGYYVTADEGYRFYNDFEPIEVDTISQAKAYANKEISYKMSDGGYMAKGGVVDYKKIIKDKEWGKSKGVWNAWTNNQRFHFIKDHFVFQHGVRIFKNFVPTLANMNWNQIVKSDYNDAIKIYDELERHIDYGQYADGGETDEYAKGGNIPSIEKRVVEVNKLIQEGNEKGVEVIDKTTTWEAPMKYKPLKYSNGVLYVQYEQLDLYMYNKGKGTKWKMEKYRIGKSGMGLDDQRETLTHIARMYRSAINHFNTYGYADGGMPTFQDKVDSISASLLKRKKVSPSVQKDYGKTYSKSEAIESAKRIAGALRKKEKARKK